MHDGRGGILPGVTVTATQTDTGLTRTRISDGNGSYTLASLPVGPYPVEFMLQGFRTYVQTGLVLQVNASRTVNATLEVRQRSGGECGTEGRHRRKRG